jgi:uncharacterized protein DUF3108
VQGSGLASSRRLACHAMILPVMVLAVTATDALHGRSLAQGRLDARYTVTLAGLAIGRGAWVIDITDDHFTAAANGATAGLLRAFTSGHGQSMVRGTVSSGQLVSTSYTSSIFTDQRFDEVRMAISSGTVQEVVADPPIASNPDRVPITEAHRRDVSDPMTASLVRVPGTSDPIGPQACPGKVSVFDGRMRYDLHLTFRRLDQVKAAKGYQGRSVVCSLQFAPIAGHVPDRAAIKYLAELRNVEVWLAPIAGTRVMVPYRASVPTPIGLSVVEATHFVSVPHSDQAGARTQ